MYVRTKIWCQRKSTYPHAKRAGGEARELVVSGTAKHLTGTHMVPVRGELPLVPWIAVVNESPTSIERRQK